MSFEQKPNTGSLFANDRREKESQPNAKGSALIGGVEYWVSAWTNTSQGGKKYQSLKFEPKADQAQASEQQSSYSDVKDGAPPPALDDEIPF